MDTAWIEDAKDLLIVQLGEENLDLDAENRSLKHQAKQPRRERENDQV